jgi:zinc transport system substrate-binding protein
MAGADLMSCFDGGAVVVKKLVTSVLVLAAAVMLLSGPATSAPVPGERMAVVASFYALYEFSQRVGADRVSVRNLVPAGAEPHDYEPTPRDVIAINEARVVVYNGIGLERWLGRLLPQIPERVTKVNASEGIPPLVVSSGESRGQPDSHVWLDPLLAQRQVDNIAAGFGRADPGGRAIYEGNARAYKARLQALHEQYQRALARCRTKVFVVNHAAFGYLAARYNLTQIAITGLEPEVEPTPARIREVLRLIRQHGVTVIYYETLASPRVAAAIAREVGARILVLNPIEGLTTDEIREGKTYLTVMEQNLRNLVQGLDCR